MKRLSFALALAALFGCAGALRAQLPADDAQNPATLKVTTVLNADGTRTDVQKDLEARTSESKTYDKQHKLIRRIVFSLNEAGNPLEGVVYDGKGKVTARMSMRYNLQGQLIEHIEKDPAGMTRRRTVMTRDPSGRVTDVCVYDAQGRKISEDKETNISQGRKKR